MSVKVVNGEVVKVAYRRRTRVPRWWPFRWPPKWVDSHITCDHIGCPVSGNLVECDSRMLFVDDTGKIWVGPYSMLEVFE